MSIIFLFKRCEGGMNCFRVRRSAFYNIFFFFNDTATTEIYTLSLHDALPISIGQRPINNIVDITNFILHETGHPMHAFDAGYIIGDEVVVRTLPEKTKFTSLDEEKREDRKSTRLNSSHVRISYAVFCLKKKKK